MTLTVCTERQDSGERGLANDVTGHWLDLFCMSLELKSMHVTTSWLFEALSALVTWTVN